MNEEQRKVLLSVLEDLQYINNNDDGQVFYRVTRRKVAEVLGLPVEKFMLLKDTKDTVKPLYCKTQYT